MNDKKNESITSRDVDFAKWYTDVVRAARLAAYSNVKGCTVFEPNGAALWEKIQRVLETTPSGIFISNKLKLLALIIWKICLDRLNFV